MKTILTILVLSILAPAGIPGGAAPAFAAEAKTKPYPLKTCIVSGNGLSSMNDEQRIVHNGQEIKFCCKPCVSKFKKNPDKYLAKLKK
jgi:YHS domain-containing protein